MIQTVCMRGALAALLVVYSLQSDVSAQSTAAGAQIEGDLQLRGGALTRPEREQSGVRNADRYIPAALKAKRRARGGVHATAIWTFDEAAGLYPSHALDDDSDNDLVMALGRGASIKAGKIGNALYLTPQPDFVVPKGGRSAAQFGLLQLPPAAGRTVPPLSWHNAHFAALITDGEDHLRKETGFTNPTDTDLNLGDFDWTVEFWYDRGAAAMREDGVVFEIGSGPRGENDKITQLRLKADGSGFVLLNEPAGATLTMPTNAAAATSSGWHHYAFTYDASANRLVHYVDGRRQLAPATAKVKALDRGDEAYFTIGKDARWSLGLKGALDEMRFSTGVRYAGDFTPPGSLATDQQPRGELAKGPPLLFADAKAGRPLPFGARKHLFTDASLLEKLGEAKLVVNPPKRAERVMGDIKGEFRKHLTVVEGDDGLIRIYNSVEGERLVVYTSSDGITFKEPDVGNGVHVGRRNVVIPESTGGMGNVFFDRNAPADERWKYLSDSSRRGLYLYTSADGYRWKRARTATLPFRGASQSATFYDDQRQTFVAYHRTDAFVLRSSVRSEHKDLREAVDYAPLTQGDYLELQKRHPLVGPLPWYADNGPLTPGGFGMELPRAFDPKPTDPVGTDLYLTKATKYEWAPDTYLAFPVAYFEYDHFGPPARQILGTKERGRGSGPLETQVSVSRNGLDWTRYPRPAYVGIGRHDGRDMKTAYIAHGMVRRGEEIWQYYFGETQYHSAHVRDAPGRGVYRLVQRLDGFVSLDSPYDREITVISRPLVFSGDRLKLNIDTDATGYAQIGFLDAKGKPIEGFGVDDCIYVNGDFIDTDVEWLKRGKDVSALAGKTVQIVFRMRGAKLYAMEFANSAATAGK